MSSVVPSGAVDVGGGVKVVRGGYDEDNGTIELPSVSGSREAPRQDGESIPMTVKSYTLDEEGETVPLRNTPLPETPAPAPAPAPAPTMAVSPSQAEEVESVGRSVVPSPPREPAPDIIGVGLDTVELINVTLKHSTGFTFASTWDFAVVTSPIQEVSTLALGTSNDGLSLPEGQYDIIIEGDSYSAFYGNQSFKSDLRYYVFVLSAQDQA